MDISAKGGGFSSTQVEFSAVSDEGKAAMGRLFGFATIGITMRKSAAWEALELFSKEGVKVKWDCDGPDGN